MHETLFGYIFDALIARNGDKCHMNLSTKKRLIVLGLVLATASWGASFFLAKAAIEAVGAWSFLFWRIGLTGLIVGIVFFGKLKSCSVKTIKTSCVLGLTLFLAFFTQVMGLQSITAGRSGFLTSLYVPFTPLFGLIILGQKSTLRQILVASIAVLGMCLLTQKETFELGSGEIWTLATAIIWGIQIVLTEKYARLIPDTLGLGVWQFVWFSLWMVVFVLPVKFFLDRSLDFGNPLYWSSTINFSLFFNILLATIFAFLLQIVAQKYMGSLKVALIFAMEAPLAAFFGYLFLGELMNPRELTGAVIIFLTGIIPEAWLKESLRG